MSNGLKTAFLLGALSALLLGLGEALGGAGGLATAFVFAALMNLGSYWFSDKIVLRMYRAGEVGPGHRLYGIVERLAVRAGLPMPKVYVIPEPSPNAFATGRNPTHAAVAATEGILQLLTDHELEGVIAHELAHVKHRDILISSVAATMAAAIMMVARMAHFAALFGGRRPRQSRRAEPGGAHRDDDFRPHCRDADSDGDLTVARVCRRRRRGRDCRQSVRAGRCAPQDRRGVQAPADGRQPGHGAHVHRQAVRGAGPHGAFQHAIPRPKPGSPRSSDGRPKETADHYGWRGVLPPPPEAGLRRCPVRRAGIVFLFNRSGPESRPPRVASLLLF